MYKVQCFLIFVQVDTLHHHTTQNPPFLFTSVLLCFTIRWQQQFTFSFLIGCCVKLFDLPPVENIVNLKEKLLSIVQHEFIEVKENQSFVCVKIQKMLNCLYDFASESFVKKFKVWLHNSESILLMHSIDVFKLCIRLVLYFIGYHVAYCNLAYIVVYMIYL